MKDGKQIATNLFSQFCGEKARNIKLGHGSFITMDFGDDVTVEVKTNRGIRKSTRGEWHLWIYMCAWRLDKDDLPLVGANDDRESITKELLILENNKILKTSVLNNAFDVLLEFEDNIKLSLFSFFVKNNEQWMLYTPDHKVFCAGPGVSWTYESSSKSRSVT